MPALIEGCPVEIQGSGSKPWTIKNVGGVYSCNCPAWRNQSVPIDKRTCKHLRGYCGDAAEAARIGGNVMPAQRAAPVAPPRASTTSPQPTQLPEDESPEDVLAAVFGRPILRPDGSIPTPVLSVEDHAIRVLQTPEDIYKQSILDRAAAEGRSLRQDEKAKLNGPPILLAQSFEDFEDLDPTGWWYSEKLDGVRGYWNGTDFISRQGNVFHAPAWFKAGLPDHPLDGELWLDRKSFQKTISIVKRLDGGDQWKAVKYVVFDLPHSKLPFEERMEMLEEICLNTTSKYLKYHAHYQVQSRQHLLNELKQIEALGGEGLMIRKPKSLYEGKRSATILKVKPFHDAEAVIIAHLPGKGRHKGRLGGLEVRMPNGKTFVVGSGLTDAERNTPPAIGETITYRYTEHTNDGLPKCASFVAVRNYE